MIMTPKEWETLSPTSRYKINLYGKEHEELQKLTRKLAQKLDQVQKMCARGNLPISDWDEIKKLIERAEDACQE